MLKRVKVKYNNIYHLIERYYNVDHKREIFQARIGHKPIECDSYIKAVSQIKSNMRVFVHGMSATPESLVKGLCIHAKENNLNNIELIHLLTTGDAPQISDEYAQHFKDNSLFVSSNVRKAVNESKAEYVPIFLSEIPALFSNKSFNIDASLCQVSPPDKQGFCSLGCSVDIARAGIANSDIIIGLINENMPRSHGDGFIHISQFDRIYHEKNALPSLIHYHTHYDDLVTNMSKIGDIISNNLIDDGACLQMGIGIIPNVICNNLKHHKNLGVHTEMFSDGFLNLYEAGCITNSNKQEHKGKLVATFAVGTQKVFDFIDDNPCVNILETNYINDINVIGSNPDVVSVNSCLQIDLSGQVVTDSIGLNIYSGVGGHLDFIRGASMSKNGKPIICLTSTTKDGISKIVPYISEGAGVVSTRAHIQYVVTEHGFVNLWGKSIKERAKLLISIAHPNHQEWLDREAHKRFKHDF